MPKTPPDLKYPSHAEVRRGPNAGTVGFQKRWLFASKALVREDVAFERTEDGLQGLRF